MTVVREFETVDAVLASGAETRGVDAFALSLIKAERQARKLFTHLIYQYPVFGASDVSALRDALVASRRVYFEGFVAGLDALYLRPVQALVGPEYPRLKARLAKAVDYRNKIFHGQLTSHWLTREDLISLAGDIRDWCTTLANGALAEVGYDGFDRNSFQKSAIPDLWKRYRVQFCSIEDYKAFIRTNMER